MDRRERVARAIASVKSDWDDLSLDVREALRLEADAAIEAMQEWRPIESAEIGHSAPKIDIWAAGERYTDCGWGAPTYGSEKGVYGWVYQSGYDCDGPVYDWVPKPTHWMPLAAPPKEFE